MLYRMGGVVVTSDEREIGLAKPFRLSIDQIVKLLVKHFNYEYSCPGGSRLPILAIYAAYQCLMREVARY